MHETVGEDLARRLKRRYTMVMVSTFPENSTAALLYPYLVGRVTGVAKSS